MKAKEMLQQVQKVEDQAENLMMQIDRMRSQAGDASAGDSENGPGGGEMEYETEEAVIGTAETEQKLNEVLERLFNLKIDMLEMIQKVPDGLLQTILIQRYLFYRKWDEIAESLQYSTRHVLRKHREALAALRGTGTEVLENTGREF